MTGNAISQRERGENGFDIGERRQQTTVEMIRLAEALA
jgi:hypothetical protein